MLPTVLIAVLLGCAGTPTPTETPTPAPTPADVPAERPEPVPVAPPAPPPPEPVEDAAPAEQPPAPAPTEGTSCLSDEDCDSGVCEGQGCTDAEPGTCVEVGMRACTRDLRPYCGCDGETFMGSSTCPNRRFAHQGPCE